MQDHGRLGAVVGLRPAALTLAMQMQRTVQRRDATTSLFALNIFHLPILAPPPPPRIIEVKLASQAVRRAVCGRCAMFGLRARVLTELMWINGPLTEAASTLLPSIGRKGLKLTGLF